MKRLFSLLMLCLITVANLSLYAKPADSEDNSDTNLVLWQKDGSKVIICMKEMPKITFQNDVVVIESATSKAEYEFAAIAKMTYDLGAENAITLQEIKKVVEYDGESIFFQPSDKDLRVRIFTINGALYREFVVTVGSPVSLPMSSLSSGVNLVNVNGVTYKIYVQ